MKLSSGRLATMVRWTLLIAAVVGIEVAVRLGAIDTLTLVSLVDIGKHLIDGVLQGEFLPNIVFTFQRILLAFALAVGIGVPLGYLFSRSPRIYEWFRPYIESYYALPVFVFYPVAVFIFGLSIWPTLLIVWLWAVGGVVLNTVIGFNRVPHLLVTYARSIQLSEWQTLRHIRVPAALPSILTGVKLAVVYSIGGTVGVEFILSSRGVGRAINDAYNSFRTADVYALILVILALAWALNAIVAGIEKRLYKLRGYAIDHIGGHPERQQRQKQVGDLSQRSQESWPRFFDWLVAPAVALVLWSILTVVAGTARLPWPTKAATTLWDLLTNGSMVDTFSSTVRNTLVAFLLSAVIGLTVGYVLGRSQFLKSIFGVWVISGYTIPKIVLYPILLFFFGFSNTSIVVYGMLHAAPAIIIFTMAAVAAVNPSHLRYGMSLQLSGWQTFRQITFPSAIPELMSGLRFGLGICFLGVLVSEMLLGGSSGAGFQIVNSSVTGNTSKMMAYIISTLALVLIVNALMAQFRKVALVWNSR